MKSFYTREGTRTEDLTSPGTIKATVSVGTAKVEVVYTIKEAPAEKPVVTPTAKPTDKTSCNANCKNRPRPRILRRRRSLLKGKKAVPKKSRCNTESKRK